jgi:hypothetical protein
VTTLVRTGGLKKKIVKPVDPWSTMLGGLQAGTVVNPKTVGSGVDDQIKAGQAGITAASALQRLQLENQAKRAQGFAQALGQITAPDPKAIADEYRTSADRLRGFGTGLTGAVAEAQQSNADRIADEVHRVTGGLGNVASYDIPNLRNVAQMTGVVMPASSLEEKAAGAYASANAERAGSVGSIGSIAQEYLRKLDELEADVGAKSTALAAQRPSLFNDALKAAQESARSNIATYIQARYLSNTMRTTDASITGVDPVTGKTTLDAKTKAAAAKAAKVAAKVKTTPVFDSSRSNALGKQVDQFGNEIGGKTVAMPGFHLDPKSPTGVTKNVKGTTLTADARRNLQKDLGTWTSVTPQKRHYDSGTGAWLKVPGTGSKPLPYGEVVKNLMTSYGLSRKQAETYANGKYGVGEYGRPYPVPPPKGSLAYSPTEVVSKEGFISKLVNGKWVLQVNSPPKTGKKAQDAAGDTYEWNGRAWVKQ